MSKPTFESLMTRVAAIRASETITKKEMSALSREALALMVETEDVRPINALLGYAEDGKFVLTVANRKSANLFFKEFVPFTAAGDETVTQFGKKKAKIWDKAVKAIEEFLAVESNDIWTWINANVDIEAKPVVYSDKLTKLIGDALAGKKGEALSQVEVLKAVLNGGVSVDALVALVTAISEQPAEQQAA